MLEFKTTIPFFCILQKRNFLSEAQTFSPANANMVLNFLELERHFLGWKAFWVKL